MYTYTSKLECKSILKSQKTQKLTVKEYNRIYNVLFPSLCVFANKFLNDHDKSQDVVQEVFIHIWNQNELEQNDELIRAYLYVSVRNKCLDFLKSKENRLKNSFVDVTFMASDLFLEKEVLTEEVFREIDIALAKLPNKCRAIIELAIRGYKNQQIADELQISINTVKTQKKIAYQRLKILLRGVYYFVIMSMIE